MPGSGIEPNKQLVERIQASLQAAEGAVAVYQKRHNRLMGTTIVSSAVSTLVAGVTAATGQAAQIGTQGWRTACIIAAIFGFISTVSTGFVQQLKTSERLAEGKQCLGQLKSLEVLIATAGKSRDEITREYQEIVRNYPDLL